MPVHEVPGDLGKFEYEISPGTLKIVLPVSFEFIPGDKTASPGFGAHEYEWQGDEEKNNFTQEFLRQTKDTWEGIFGFHGYHETTSEQDQWLEFVVDIEERADPIWRVFALKEPRDKAAPAASVCEPGTRHFGAGCTIHSTGDSWGSLSISSALTRPTEALFYSGDGFTAWFKKGTAELSSEHKLRVELLDLIRRLSSGSDWTARLIGAASSDEIMPAQSAGAAPHPAITLARARVNTLTGFLEAHGVSSANLSQDIKNPLVDDIGDDPAYVEVLGSCDRQSTIAHEVGHFFGLEDEYPSDSYPRGERIKSDTYAQLIRDWGFTVPFYESSRSVMSQGSTLYPRHFTPFLDLLARVRPDYEWYLVPA